MRNLLILFLVLIAFVSFAQNKTIDSLQRALKDFDAKKLELRKNLLPDASDTTKANIFADLSMEFIRVSDYAAGRKYADDALAIAQQINFKKGIARSYFRIGVIYDYQGNYPEALKYQVANLKIREELGDKKGISYAYITIGDVNMHQGNYPEALRNNFIALKITEELGDKNGATYSYMNIASIYYRQGNYPEALKNYSNALKLSRETGDKNGIAMSYNNIGIIYVAQVNYPEALKNYFASIKLSEETGDRQNVANCYNNIGDIYSRQANYPQALNNHFSSLKIRKEIGDKSGIATSYFNIGDVKLKSHEAAEAKTWMMKGLNLAKEIEALELLQYCYDGLAAADSALGNFKGAYENHKLFVLYRDSLNNEESTKKSLQTKMQYEFDKKEAETKAVADGELKKQKLLRNGFVGGFAVVLLFAGVFFRQRNKTMKEKQRSDTLLLNILPGEVADEIKISGTAKAKAFTMVTVMFTDFKDFTTVSEKISAELLVDEIHTCFSAFDNILHKFRIEKIKTIGDAYLCASGLPVSNYTHALDMLNAAFEIRSFMLERKKEKEANGEIPFELRIGIHTGPVVAGVVGVKKYAYDIWGDTVNIAARMEQNSEAGKINISGATYELVKEKFNCIYRGKIQAKNKGEIDMYFAETVS